MALVRYNRNGVRVLARPHPGPQSLYLALPDDVEVVLYGGARGGGKTWVIMLDVHRRDEKYGSNFVGAIIRKKRTELKDFIRQAARLLTPLGWIYKKQEKEFIGPNGGVLLVGYAETEDDIAAWKGYNLTNLYLEELTEWAPRMILGLFRLAASLRSTDGVPTRLSATTNPDGVGSGLVKELFVEGKEPFVIFDFKFTEDDFDDTVVHKKAVFIPSTIDDNPSINTKVYEANLKLAAGQNKALYEAWRNGSWENIQGLAFDEFSRSIHGLKDFRLPNDWSLVGGLDFGYKDPSVFVLAAVSPMADEFVIWYEMSWKEKMAREAGEDLGMELLKLGVPAKMIINCDGQMWAKTGGIAGTIADEFSAGLEQAMGREQMPVMINIAHGPGAIAMRFNLIKSLLSYKKETNIVGAQPKWGGPKLRVVLDECPYLVKVFESLGMSKKRDNQYDTDGDDHPIDALGYLLVGTANTTVIGQSRVQTAFDRHPGLDAHGQRVKVRDGVMAAPSMNSWFQMPDEDDWVSI